MRACMFDVLCACMCSCTFVNAYTCRPMYGYITLYTFIHVCKCIRTYCVYVSMYPYYVCVCMNAHVCMGVRIFIHSFIPVISIAPLQVLYYSEALPTTARILYRSFTPKRTGNCR